MLIYNARDKSAPLYSGGSYLCVPRISYGNRRSYHFCLPAAAFVTNTKTHNDEKWLTNRCHSRNTEGGGKVRLRFRRGSCLRPDKRREKAEEEWKAGRGLSLSLSGHSRKNPLRWASQACNAAFARTRSYSGTQTHTRTYTRARARASTHTRKHTRNITLK